MSDPDTSTAHASAETSGETATTVGASFNTAMVHFYRGELQRMTVWRTRLDTTSNWAVLLTTGMTTFTLGSQQTPHYIMLLGLALVGMCMLLEARRYQHLHHSKWRLRLLEGSYFGSMLDPARPCDSGWRLRLAADLDQPRFTIGLLAAMRLRLRRNYLMLMLFVTAVWLTKLFIQPQSPGTAREFYARLSVGDLLPSWFVLASAGLFVTISTLLAVTSPSEEALERWVPCSMNGVLRVDQ